MGHDRTAALRAAASGPGAGRCPPTRAVAFELLAAAVDGSAGRADRSLDAGPTCSAAAGVVLDIGFGGGEGLIAMAALVPQECVIGVEVHTPGVAKVLEAIDAHGWQHVRVVEGDVLDFLPRLPPGSLAGVRIWFPDPWPKRKQQHRRLVRPRWSPR